MFTDILFFGAILFKDMLDNKIYEDYFGVKIEKSINRF